jgi:hypothetical protein
MRACVRACVRACAIAVKFLRSPRLNPPGLIARSEYLLLAACGLLHALENDPAATLRGKLTRPFYRSFLLWRWLISPWPAAALARANSPIALPIAHKACA